MKISVVSLILRLALLLSWLNVAAQQTPDFDALIRQGNSQLQAGSNEQALASAVAGIKLDAGRWEAYAVAGGALFNLKRYEDAADQFSHAIDRAPETKQAGLRSLRKQCVIAESRTSPFPTPAQSSSQTGQAELVFWKAIEHSRSIADFQAYLQKYPNGAYVPLAQQYLKELQINQSRPQGEGSYNAITVASTAAVLHIFRNMPQGWDKFAIRVDGIPWFTIENKHSYRLLLPAGSHTISAGDQGYFAPSSSQIETSAKGEYWLRVSYYSPPWGHAKISFTVVSQQQATKQMQNTQETAVASPDIGRP